MGARAQTVAAELAAKGIAAVAHVANVTKEADVKAMVEAAVASFGGLHIAVNNAGVNKNSAAEDTPLAEWDMTFDVNPAPRSCAASSRVVTCSRTAAGRSSTPHRWPPSSCPTRRSRRRTTAPRRRLSR